MTQPEMASAGDYGDAVQVPWPRHCAATLPVFATAHCVTDPPAGGASLRVQHRPGLPDPQAEPLPRERARLSRRRVLVALAVVAAMAVAMYAGWIAVS